MSNSRTASLVAAAAAALFVVSCTPRPFPGVGGKPENPPAAPGVPAALPNVVGKWLTPTGGSIEFRPDGSATMGGPAGSREVRYRLPDHRTIEISRPGGPATIRWQIISLGPQELVVKDSDGLEVRLRRG